MKRLAATLSLALVLAAAPAVAGEDRHMTIRKTATGVKGIIHASAACANDQPVKLQKKKSAPGWKTLKKKRTGGDGRYKFRLELKAGKKYRTLSPANGGCAKVISDPRFVTG